MRKFLLYVFAIIGFLCSIKVIHDIVVFHSEATNYVENCEKVKVGMTLSEAKEIMGDRVSWETANESEIISYFVLEESFNREHGKRKTYLYYLDYPTEIGSSIDLRIYFDPKTQIVTEVICDI